MAFVDGETLAQRVHERGPLPPSEASRILREVAWALASAHAQGLVHRDVKPDNILIERASGRVLVTDFGIAAAAGDAGDGIAGTPEFMSPEQALGGDIDARSDLYGLGATAFFALTGRLPFEGTSATEILARQVTEVPPPLASLRSLGLARPRSCPDRTAPVRGNQLHRDARPPGHRAAAAARVTRRHRAAQARPARRSLPRKASRPSPRQRAGARRATGARPGAAPRVPAALRAFVKRYGRLDGGGTLVALFLLLSGSIVIAALFGATAGFVTLLLGVTVAPFAYLVVAARRLSLLGFTHQDLDPAFKGEIEQAREELTVEHRSGPSSVERYLPPLMKVTGAVGVLATVGLFLGPSSPFFQAAASDVWPGLRDHGSHCRNVPLPVAAPPRRRYRVLGEVVDGKDRQARVLGGAQAAGQSGNRARHDPPRYRAFARYGRGAALREPPEGVTRGIGRSSRAAASPRGRCSVPPRAVR